MNCPDAMIWAYIFGMYGILYGFLLVYLLYRFRDKKGDALNIPKRP